MAERSGKTVVLIGVFRLTKAAVLVVLGVGALLSAKGPAVSALQTVADASGFFWARAVLERAVHKIFALNAHSMHELGVASLAYAAVFTVEGTGLVLRKRWAEWLTIVVTSSFIPFEIYELVHRPGAGKVVAIVVNVAIVVYLIVRQRQRMPSFRRLGQVPRKIADRLSI